MPAKNLEVGARVVQHSPPTRRVQTVFGRPEPQDAEPKSKTPMPSSWQEFQFLQQSVERYTSDGEVPVPPKDQEKARQVAEKLAEVYPVFMNIIQEGWEFIFDPDVESAGVFVQKMRKWEEGLAGGKAAVIEWDLEAERQPFIGENKQE
eukprot:Transcript_15176.p3 GENE.Transcript_15176~~Transcript_15176.p3  ORF type:complete len:149 (+),score=62.93 Transcript_15176:631-1077(+)